MRFKSILSALAFAALCAGPALAADGHDHAHDHAHDQPMHGGLIAEAKELSYELVARADSLTLYATEHGQPLATAGAKASATVHAGGGKQEVTLEPAGDNRLVAKGSFKTGLGVRVAVLVSLPGQPEAKLNFRLK